QEVIDGEILKKIIKVRPLKIYWGTAPTGKIHIGYFMPLLKLADFLKAGCEVTILLADLHAFLDNQKSSLKNIEIRSKYYKEMITRMLQRLGVNTDNLKFVEGSTFQLTKEYTMDVYRAHSMISLNEAKHAGAGVVKLSDNPAMNGLIYPTLQALDEEYLKVDAQFGGTDQRKIMTHSRKILPKLGYKKRIQLMSPMITALSSTKKEEEGEVTQMSSSNGDGKIEILFGKKKIKKAINSAYCLEGDIDDNTVLVLCKSLVFPLLKHL
ncbi:unnamed protein product, partial [marine sediment metagenome]